MDSLSPFVFTGLFTPGPNVILLTASVARFGFARRCRMSPEWRPGSGSWRVSTVTASAPVSRVAGAEDRVERRGGGVVGIMALRLLCSQPEAPRRSVQIRPLPIWRAILFQ
jgi:hypothetical protein